MFVLEGSYSLVVTTLDLPLVISGVLSGSSLLKLRKHGPTSRWLELRFSFFPVQSSETGHLLVELSVV